MHNSISKTINQVNHTFQLKVFKSPVKLRKEELDSNNKHVKRFDARTPTSFSKWKFNIPSRAASYFYNPS